MIFFSSFVNEHLFRTICILFISSLILISSIKAGDYLIIGFGHNDEKSDDGLRFTDASKPTTDSTSFKYSLYENYIKVAIEKGATPILCTPIVRLSLNKDYSGTVIHETVHGDYRKNILDLGEMTGVTSIDLTTPTKDLFNKLNALIASAYSESDEMKDKVRELVPTYVIDRR